MRFEQQKSYTGLVLEFFPLLWSGFVLDEPGYVGFSNARPGWCCSGSDRYWCLLLSLLFLVAVGEDEMMGRWDRVFVALACGVLTAL